MSLEVVLSVNGKRIRRLEVSNQGPTDPEPYGSTKQARQARERWDPDLCRYTWSADDDTRGAIVHHRNDGAERLARRALQEYIVATKIGMIPA